MIGLLLVDKPTGMTSHDVVDRIRRAAKIRRVGHTGTLDPGATGLLVLCLGPATRLSEHLTALDKVYEGVMRLGVETDSYDMDGRVLEERPVPELSMEALQKVCGAFSGEIDQIPPMVSAVKVGGERLYKRARKGEVVERKPRRVTVREFAVRSWQSPDAEVRVVCTSGTYVRALCHDVGARLECGGMLASLRRTRVGRYSVDDAATLDVLRDEDSVRERLLSMDDALDLPEVIVKPGSQAVICAGGTLTIADMQARCTVQEGWVQIKSPKGKLLALGTAEPTAAGPRVHAKRVFIK